MPNEFDQPKLKLNGIEYALLYKPENEDFKLLSAGMLKTGQYYNLVFNGSQFIVENGSLPATPESAGNISLNEIRRIIEELTGYEYDRLFGAELTSVVQGKVYLYTDSNGNSRYFKALSNASYPGGILVPNGNFLDITSRNLIENAFMYSTPHNTGLLTIAKKSGFVNLNYHSTLAYQFVTNDTVLSFSSPSLDSFTIKPKVNYDSASYILRDSTGGEFRLFSTGIKCVKSMGSLAQISLNFNYISESF